MSFVRCVNLIGRSSNAGATDNPIWGPGGGVSYVQLTTGTALELVSDSANDAAAGTGARTIQVFGLDGNYIPFVETVTMSGTTPVALVNNSAVAINKVRVLTAGSGGTNAGVIVTRTVSGAVTKAQIDNGPSVLGQNFDFIYTIPASMYGKVRKIEVTGSGLTGNLTTYLESYTSTGVKVVEAQARDSLTNTGFSRGKAVMNFGDGLYIPEKTLLVLKAGVSATTAQIMAIGQIELHSK